MLCIMPLYQRIGGLLVSSFGMQARRSLLRVVQRGGYVHRSIAIEESLQNAAMVKGHFDDRYCSASAFDSQLDRSNQSRIDHTNALVR